MYLKKYFPLIFLIMFWQVLPAGTSFFGFGPNLLGSYQYLYSTAAFGRGGFSMATVDSVSINQANFATWSHMTLTTFSLNMQYQGLTAQTSEGRELSLTNANFMGGYIAWPIIQKKMAMGIGLVPYAQSDLGVKIENVGIGAPATQFVESDGTISDAKFIISLRITENLSVGIAPTFNFGVITDKIKIDYNDVAYGDINIENRYQVHGVTGEISGYYELGNWLAAGARFRLPTKLTVYATQNSQTAEKTIEDYRDLTLPLGITLGMAIKFSPRFLVGMDVFYQDWKKGYRVDDRSILNMHNSFRIGAGLERGPSRDRFSSYFQKMTLRAGAFYGQLNVESNGEPINEYGLAIGLGMPIMMNRNRFDISAEIGQRGDKSINFVEEMFFRLNFAISTNELWFVQQDR